MKKLVNDVNRYRRRECNYLNNIRTPGRCKAAYIYNDKLNRFIENEVNNSRTNTKKIQEKLLKDRIKNKEHKNIYPLVNHDFDYRTALAKKYNPFELGITNQPTINSLFKSPAQLVKFNEILLKKKFPNKSTVAGVDDVIEEDTRLKQIKGKYNEMNETLPYPSFHKDYPKCRYKTTGENSSSYFIRTGVCKTKIDNEPDCLSKEYTWYPNKPKFPKIAKELISTKKNTNPVVKVSGTCYKPRFTYIDNSSKGFFGNNGLAPSMFSDIMNIAPEKLFEVLSGNSVEGGGILPCTEEFTNYKSNSRLNYYISNVVVLILIMIVGLYVKRYLK